MPSGDLTDGTLVSDDGPDDEDEDEDEDNKI